MPLGRKVVSAITLTLLLAGMFTVAFNIQTVNADSGTIYVRADGSIDPSTAPISTVDNVTYTLNGNIINDSIVIEKDNIVVDGAGYTLKGTNASKSIGVDLTGRSNVTITQMNIQRYWYGIYLDNSSGNYISGNNITASAYQGILLGTSNYNSISGNNIANNGFGILLIPSSNHNTISGNNLTNNEDGIDLYSSSNHNIISGNNITVNPSDTLFYYFGVYLHSSSSTSISGNRFINSGLFCENSTQNSVENDTVNGMPLVYLEGVSNYTVDYAGQVILVKCDNITVEGFNLSRTTVGIEVWETSNSTISGNNITANNIYGIYLYSSLGNSISANNIVANKYSGIFLYYSSNYNSISENNITDNGYDIWNGLDGILLYSSSYNSISGNNITNNNHGIDCYFSGDDSFFHNNFVNNTVQASSSSGSANVWDDGYPSGGNYWSDYNSTDAFKGPYQNETGSDGIGDSPYSIDESNTDRYPLTHLWVRLSGDVNGDRIVDIYDAILLANAYGSSPGKEKWNLDADINGDNIVDIYDAILLANHYNQYSP